MNRSPNVMAYAVVYIPFHYGASSLCVRVRVGVGVRVRPMMGSWSSSGGPGSSRRSSRRQGQGRLGGPRGDRVRVAVV